MADITISTEQFEEVAQAMGLSGNVADRFRQSLEEMTSSATRAGDAVGFLSSKAEDLKDGLRDLSRVDITKFIVSTQNVLVDAKSHMDSMGISTTQVGAALLSMVGPIQKVVSTFSTFREFGSGAKDASSNISEMAKKFEELGILTGPLKMAADLGEAAQSGNRAETQLLRLMGGAGQLGGTFGELGRHMEGIANRTVEMSRIQSEVGTAMGMTAQQIAPYLDSLQKIPDAFNQVVDAGEAAGGEMHALEASMKVARGTSQEYSDVLQQLDKHTLDFGSSNTEALESISRMYSATQTLGLRMRDVRSYVENVGDSFKYFGNNTSSSIEILARLGPALRNSGLGASATTELVGKFTQGIQQMDIAQRGFLSGQTGGPGGLTGGLKIEEMLASGDVAGVAEKIEQVMRQQVGGKLITREEASTGGEGAARQFELQRQMLRSGPFGDLAGSPEAASKLIDAMAEGSFDQVNDLIQGDDEALSSAIMDGNTIAERHANIATKHYNEFVHFNNALDANNAKVGREFVRPGGALDIDDKGLDAMRNASQRASGRDMGIDSERMIMGAEEDIGNLVDKLTNMAKDAGVDEDAINKIIPPSIRKLADLAPKIMEATSSGEKLDANSIKRFLQEKMDVSRPTARAIPQGSLFAIPPIDRSRRSEVSQMSQMASQEKGGQKTRRSANDPLGTLVVKVQTDKGEVLKIIDQQIQDNNERSRSGDLGKVHIGTD